MADTPTKVHRASSAGAVHAETPVAVEDEKVIAAVAYIFTWLTGLIILLTAKRDQRYARWNAVQAIALGFASFAVAVGAIIFSTMTVLLAGDIGSIVVSLLNALVWLGLIALIVVSAIKAYQGTPLRLPLLAGFADKYA